ncbi:MAG: hypothetical protein MUP63_04420 [Candidatus Nanohaloarchaeota archaeon QJJ-7]|nr:hypothetical protein [Candidatus Nanohaloarchaeota archaeon QJJ-7]
MIEVFVPLFGLVTAFIVHIYFYFEAYVKDPGFTGLLRTEERYLMDTSVAIGSLQILYFLWRSINELFVIRADTDALLGVAVLGLFSLGIFTYRSLSLLNNMKKVGEKYGFDIDLGDRE